MVVNKPVWETAERQVCQTVMKPVRETVYRTENQTTYQPVTTCKTEYVDRGCYQDQVVLKPGLPRNRLQWSSPETRWDPITGTQVNQPAGLYWHQAQRGTYEVQKIWRPNIVAQQVPVTTLVPQVVTRQVPVEVCRYEPEQVRTEPTRSAGWSGKSFAGAVHGRKPVCERVERQVPVRVCRWVDEEVVRQVPPTTYGVVYEEQVERVPVPAGWWPTSRRSPTAVR